MTTHIIMAHTPARVFAFCGRTRGRRATAGGALFEWWARPGAEVCTACLRAQEKRGGAKKHGTNRGEQLPELAPGQLFHAALAKQATTICGIDIDALELRAGAARRTVTVRLPVVTCSKCLVEIDALLEMGALTISSLGVLTDMTLPEPHLRYGRASD